ncbi:putative uncharacterized protein DDB_G0289263 isoform X1 [Hylaeus volcanicus]|uniref:putative uncharacterized protein DDB_G0289263 isoform X1 n=2 Tax=Hylaeus volcanicus TaxID=313075 RepID=UPI0023B874E9|nr:putative uncharacterized protein DDB_G0289263 isoform X1 [Hylaeus volcanicus]
MQDLCPMCLKNGVKKKVKLLQINLQEGVWVCEDEKCVWPFGYEDFVFYHRVVGKIWSCYWDDCKSTSKLKEAIAIPTKSALCSASTTSENMSNECISSTILGMNHSESIDRVNNSSNTMETSTNHVQNSDDKESNILLHVNKTEPCNVNNSLSKISTTGLNLDDSSLQLVNNSTKNMKIENEFVNSLDVHVKEEKVSCTQNINNLRGIPKITNIEKTNIDISNIVIGNKNSVNKDLDTKISSINKTADNIGGKLTLTNSELFSNDLLESEKVVNSIPLENNQLNNEVTATKSNLNVTMMEIDGLPPITLSFEIPASTIPETVTSSTQQTNNCIINAKSNISNVESMSLIRNVASGKQYAKFSFNALKKKTELNNSVHTINTDSLNTKSNTKIRDVENEVENCTKNENTNEYFISNQSSNSITTNNFLSQENITSSGNTSVNINTVLEDFLRGDYSVSEDINDEWLNSLLTE